MWVPAGPEGVLAVDTLPGSLSKQVIAAIRSISDKPIHYIVDTQADEDHTGGNEALAAAGPTRPDRVPLLSGLGGNAGGITSIIAHENVQKRMRTPAAGGGSARPGARGARGGARPARGGVAGRHVQQRRERRVLQRRSRAGAAPAERARRRRQHRV